MVEAAITPVCLDAFVLSCASRGRFDPWPPDELWNVAIWSSKGSLLLLHLVAGRWFNTQVSPCSLPQLLWCV